MEQLEGRWLLASYTWDGTPDGGGTSADANWRTNTNWRSDILPIHPVSDIELPAGAANLSNFNDYAAGSTFNSILMSGGGYTLQGNAITMSSGITSTIPAGSSNTVSLPISLTADQTWTSTTAGSTLDMGGGAVDLRGFYLTVSGSGTTILGPIADSTDAGGNNGIIAEGGTVVLSSNSTTPMFAGVHSGTLQVLGSATQTLIDINGGTLTTDAAATTGPIQMLGFNGGRVAPGGEGTTGILSTQGNVVMNGLGFNSFAVDLNGTTVGSGYDALHVAGTATLGGFLNVHASYASTTGSSYTILTATAGVSGTFTGLNDLDTFVANGRTFQIDYTPNSVGLTDVTVEFTVNANTDQADANTSDGLCDTDLATPGLQCTLRAAIQQANASADSNVIKFNIPGDGVHTISPTSALPTITNPVAIDGYTQPGASPNTLATGDDAKLLIELSGANVATGLKINANDSILRGLVINQFAVGAAVSLGGQNDVVEGNFIGTNAAGTTAEGNAYGVVSTGANSTIGGTTPSARNLIYTGQFSAVLIDEPAHDNLIEGNFIGTDITGTAKMADDPSAFGGYGIQIALSDNNLVFGNVFASIVIISYSSTNKIQGNMIGTDLTGTAGLGSSGVLIYNNSSNNLIGGTTPGAGNVIAFNAGFGIQVTNAGDGTSLGNSILGNSIYKNKRLGIVLGDNTVSPLANDAGDADSGPNNLQNYPVITAAAVAGTQLSLTYSVPSNPAKSQYPLRIEFFKADATGQGQTFLGSDTYTQAQAGAAASVTFTSPVSISPTDTIVATATDNAGNTSEFSPAVAFPACLTVVNTDDSGLGSLRQAILCANAGSGTDTITFNIPGNSVHTISPLSPLPTITSPVIIDGYTQPGASPNTNGPTVGDNANLLIELNGSSAGTSKRGLDFPSNSSSGGSTVRGLVINHFSTGVFLGSNGNVIAGNSIGINPAGTSGSGTANGVLVAGANNRIGGADADDGATDGQLRARNVISGCSNAGILINQTANLVEGNLIGTKANGTAPLANGYGVEINIGSSNLIGGSANGAGNVISGNQIGISITTIGEPTAGGVIQGNLIGTDVTGTANLGNADNGVVVDGPFGFIGGTDPGTGNVIAYNVNNGIVIQPEVPALNNIRILGNSIYQNGDLGIDLVGDGPTPNDSTAPADADTGPNNLQNFPMIAYATRDVDKLKVQYTVPSDPLNSTYPMRVEFFLSDVKGQGKTYLGSDMLTQADFMAGGKTAILTPASPIKVFDTIVVTATDSLAAAAGGGPANTSEFSPMVTIISPWKNPGRLRWDVNDDTFVAADDVVAIINYINAKGSGQMPDTAPAQKPFCDVDGDYNVVATDVVQIINYINAGRQLGGEAEAAPPTIDDGVVANDGDVLALLAADLAAQAVRKRRG